MSLKKNIIYLYFKGKHLITSKSQYQYNHGQYLYFSDLDLPQAFEVHFSNKDGGESKTQIGSNKLVEIPDEYFWNGALQIYAWVYLHDGTDDGETIYEVRIPLIKRAKPTDEEPLPVQQSAIDKAIAELNNAVDITNENADKTNADKTQVATIKEEVITLKEEIDSTASTVSQDAQSARKSADASEQSAQNSAEFERKALDYADEAKGYAQSALESKNITSQKAQVASDASAEASDFADSASQSASQAEQFKNQSATNVTHYPKVVDGYWYVWDASKNEYVNTNVDARGVKGDKGDIGDVGNGIASTVLNNDYTLTINFTDGTQYTTPPIRGQQGEKGDQGKIGESGVYIGENEPTDEDIKVWIDTDENEDSGIVGDLIADGSISEAKLTDTLNRKIDKVNAKVQLQRVFRIVCPKYEQVGQCAVYTGHSFIFGSPANSNTHHRIVETDMDGNILAGRDVSWDNNEVLGHMNDMYYYDKKIYVMGANRTIVVIDYGTLQIESTIPLNTADILGDHEWISLPTLDGVDGTLYTVGAFKEDGDRTKRVFRIDLPSGELTEICSFSIPEVHNGVKRIGQGFAIHDGKGYLAFNYDNAVIEFNLFDGTVYNWLLIVDGDGSVPVGEVETCVFVDGQMYIWGPLYYTFDDNIQRTQIIDQLFKTNIGGFVSFDRRYGQGEEMPSVIRVSGSATTNNPDGYTEASAFNSIEEACIVYAYRARSTHMGISQLYVSNPTGLEGQSFYLEGINFRANLNGASFGSIELRQANGFITNFSADSMEIYASMVVIDNATIANMSNIIGSRIYVMGAITKITKIESSVIDLRGGTTTNPNNISFGTITKSKIKGGHTINLDSTLTVGKSITYTLPNLQNAKIRALPNAEAMAVNIMIAGAGWGGSQASSMIRFPGGDMNNVKSGQTKTRKGSFVAVISSDTDNYMVVGVISVSINLTELSISLEKCYRTDTNETVSTNVYMYETALIPMNDQNFG